MKYFFPKHTLSSNEISLIPEAILDLFTAFIKVSLLPSKKYLPLTSGKSKIFLSAEKLESAKIIASVINGLSERTPWRSTCLIKVLATNKLFRRRKIGHTIHLGVKIKSSKEFEAHAWLSVSGKVLIGADNLLGYKEISKITS